jgi:hypothetical protein
MLSVLAICSRIMWRQAHETESAPAAEDIFCLEQAIDELAHALEMAATMVEIGYRADRACLTIDESLSEDAPSIAREGNIALGFENTIERGALLCSRGIRACRG